MNVWSVRKQSESFRFARVPEGTLFVIRIKKFTQFRAENVEEESCSEILNPIKLPVEIALEQKSIALRQRPWERSIGDGGVEPGMASDGDVRVAVVYKNDGGEFVGTLLT